MPDLISRSALIADYERIRGAMSDPDLRDIMAALINHAQRQPAVDAVPLVHGEKTCLYRVTYEGVGVYEAYKRIVDMQKWRSFLADKKNAWLPKPPKYDGACKSYFTEEGFNKFMAETLPEIARELKDKGLQFSKITVYKDPYQVVIREEILPNCGAKMKGG